VALLGLAYFATAQQGAGDLLTDLAGGNAA
jgi:hypothetical protein